MTRIFGTVLLALMVPPVSLALPTLLADQAPTPTFFDGARSEAVVWNVAPSDPLVAWSIVAIVRPTPATAVGCSRTIVASDLGGWNDDVLLGICPEDSSITPAGSWSVIHQDDAAQVRTMANPREAIVGDQFYHVAATSDGTALRLYVDGHLRACPAPRGGSDLDFDRPASATFIGGNGVSGARYFEGDILSVKIFAGALTASEVGDLALNAGLYDTRPDPYVCAYIDDVEVDGLRIDQITSFDVVNGYEVITDLRGAGASGGVTTSRFVYRPIGDTAWQVATPLAEPVNLPHSIAWAALDPPRYVVSDTDNNRVVTFASLGDGTIHDVRPSVDGVALVRPHDLEFNPVDGYCYGVTAPYLVPGDKILFRFNDVDDGSLVLAPSGTSSSGAYMRSLSIVDGVVYVIDSYGDGVGSPPFAPRVFEIHDFATGDFTIYQAPPAWRAEMQDAERHNGWWYGTGTNKGSSTPLLARWRSWSDFESGSWQDLSQLVPVQGGAGSELAYFLTRWDERLFFTAFETQPASRHDWVFELIDGQRAGLVFGNGFESGSVSGWSASSP